jgi:DNA-directed RNA polymerase specialized sigma24 family protein
MGYRGSLTALSTIVGEGESPWNRHSRLLIQAAERGDEPAADALFSALYAELHRIARRELARQGAPVSMGATTLLHEDEMAAKDGASFPDRARFMAYASRVMRGLIIALCTQPQCSEARRPVSHYFAGK